MKKIHKIFEILLGLIEIGSRKRITFDALRIYLQDEYNCSRVQRILTDVRRIAVKFVYYYVSERELTEKQEVCLRDNVGHVCVFQMDYIEFNER